MLFMGFINGQKLAQCCARIGTLAGSIALVEYPTSCTTNKRALDSEVSHFFDAAELLATSTHLDQTRSPASDFGIGRLSLPTLPLAVQHLLKIIAEIITDMFLLI